MNKQKFKISPQILMVFISLDLLFLILSIPFISNLLGMGAKTPIHELLKGKEYISIIFFVLWIALTIVFTAFIIAINISGGIKFSTNYTWKKIMEKVFSSLGITFTKKRNFLVWSIYDAVYQGLKIQAKLHTAGEDNPDILDVRIFHLKSLGFGIVLRSKGVACIDSGEGRDIFAKTIKHQDPFFSGIDIYAKKKEMVETILCGGKVTESLRRLISIFLKIEKPPQGAIEKFFGGTSTGFYMNDKYISLRFLKSLVMEDNEENIKELIVNTCKLSQAFFASTAFVVS